MKINEKITFLSVEFEFYVVFELRFQNIDHFFFFINGILDVKIGFFFIFFVSEVSILVDDFFALLRPPDFVIDFLFLFALLFQFLDNKVFSLINFDFPLNFLLINYHFSSSFISFLSLPVAHLFAFFYLITAQSSRHQRLIFYFFSAFQFLLSIFIKILVFFVHHSSILRSS